MEIISRKGGGLPHNYAETSVWLNPEPWRALGALRIKLVESFEPTEAVLAPVAVGSADSDGASFQMRRKPRRRR